MLTTQDRERLTDFFEGFELVEYLRVTVEDVIDAFEDDIEDALDDLNELMGIRQEEKEEEE